MRTLEQIYHDIESEEDVTDIEAQKVGILTEKGLKIVGTVLQKGDDTLAIVSEYGRVEWFKMEEIWRIH